MAETERAQTPLLELDLLRTLVAITEAGNFSAAAEVLHRTPSAVSVQVKRLEEALGRTLFVRDSRSVALTADGEVLLAHARRMLALNREVLLRFSKPALAGVVTLGAFDHAAERYLPELLCRFAAAYPAVTVDVTVENSVELVRKQRRRALDIAIIACGARETELPTVEIVMHEALVWAGALGGVAAERTPLPVSVWEEGCAWREAALAALERQGREYRVAFKSASIAGQKAAVLADMVIAPLPLSACDGGVIALGENSGLAALPDFPLGMLVASDAAEPVVALAGHLRESLSSGRGSR